MKTATNITELIRSQDLDDLLLFCGERATNSSDFLYFCEICRAFPMLKGHDFSAWFPRLLHELFEITWTPNLEHCALIWHAVADGLSQTSVPVASYCYRQGTLGGFRRFSLIPTRQTVCMDADLLLHTPVRTWDAWQRELESHFFDPMSTDAVFLQLPQDLPTDLPAVYHVERALESGEQSVLRIQLLRFLASSPCFSKTRDIILDVSDVESEVLIGLLKRLKSRVGLPTIILSVHDLKLLEPLFGNIKARGLCHLRLGLQLNSHINGIQTELLSALAMQYPIGRLFVYRKEGNTVHRFSVF